MIVSRKHRKLSIAAWVCAVLVLLLGTVFFVYTGSWSRADAAAQDALQSTDGVRVTHEQAVYAFLPGKKAPPLTASTIGYVFYPGGKVDPIAYAPMAAGLAQKGIPVFIPEMPFHLAFFDTQAAGRVMAKHTEIGRWAVGGHSLGGVAASLFAAKHPESVQAMVLLASYPAQDMHNRVLPVLSLKGSLDGLVTDLKFQEKKRLLPSDALYQVLEGGNHAQFGSYGIQKGDPPAKVKPAEQWEWTITQTADFLKSLK